LNRYGATIPAALPPVPASDLTPQFCLVKLSPGSAHHTPGNNMKNKTLCCACIAILPLAGCSRSGDAASQKSEAGRGTFVSTSGEAVTAIYYETGNARNGGTVELFFPDRPRVELFQAISASGARYTNKTAEWWEHQGEAAYNVGGSNLFRGKLLPSK
jgi:membrane-bound inhibitor of C-type lysozyme